MEIGNKLKNARNEKGITQEQAAELLDVSRQTISNWENCKSYPDIISVIKMSDVYSVSLDHLLKEKKSMNQTYQEYLAESTNTVKAKKQLGEIMLFATCFICWIIAMIIFWLTKNPMSKSLYVILKGILLPLLFFISTIIIGKNNYWGKGNLISIIVTGLVFMTVPYTNFIVESDIGTFIFQFPNFSYMLVGIIISAFGIGIGSILRKKK